MSRQHEDDREVPAPDEPEAAAVSDDDWRDTERWLDEWTRRVAEPDEPAPEPDRSGDTSGSVPADETPAGDGGDPSLQQAAANNWPAGYVPPPSPAYAADGGPHRALRPVQPSSPSGGVAGTSGSVAGTSGGVAGTSDSVSGTVVTATATAATVARRRAADRPPFARTGTRRPTAVRGPRGRRRGAGVGRTARPRRRRRRAGDRRARPDGQGRRRHDRTLGGPHPPAGGRRCGRRRRRRPGADRRLGDDRPRGRGRGPLRHRGERDVHRRGDRPRERRARRRQRAGPADPRRTGLGQPGGRHPGRGAPPRRPSDDDRQPPGHRVPRRLQPPGPCGRGRDRHRQRRRRRAGARPRSSPCAPTAA